MKKMEAVIQAFKADEVREALANEKIARITIFEVKGAGSEQGTPKHYRGTRYIQDSTDVKIEIVADNDDAERIANLSRDTLRTGPQRTPGSSPLRRASSFATPSL